MTNMTQIGIAGGGTGGVYRPVNRDKILSDVFPVVGPVPTDIMAADGMQFDDVSDYIDCIQAQAAFFTEVLKDVEDIAEVLLDSYGFDGNWYYTFASASPADIADFAELFQGDALTEDERLLEIFADSVATEMGRHKKQYNGIAVDDLVEHEKDNYTIVPDQEGNGAWFKRKDQVEAAPVRVSTEVPDPWAPLEDDEHY